MMSSKVLVGLFVIAYVASDFAWAQQESGWEGADTTNANEFCTSCSGRRNSKDFYAHPTDCHKYYQCFFYNETFAIGLLRTCGPGTFFVERYQSCSHEGPQQCQDVCLNETVIALGCAPIPGSCSQYVWCSTSTELMCCPQATRFNPQTCSCDADETCTDVCVQPSPSIATSVAPAVAINATHCQDAFGNILTSVPGRPDLYGIVDVQNDNAIIERPCATGSQFSLEQCSCSEIVAVNPETQPSSKQCAVYLPFDTDAADYSIHKSVTNVIGDASLSTQYSARGPGSFFFNGGRVELPATKTYDLQNRATICLFYRCPNGTCPVGGLLSNNNNQQKTSYSFIMASEPGNKVRALFRLQYPISEQEISGTVTPSGSDFNQVCVTFESAYSGAGVLKLYINNQFVGQTPFPIGWTFVANCPFTVGTDQLFGDFRGNIDEVLICPHLFTPEEVNAHYQGQVAMRQANLIP